MKSIVKIAAAMTFVAAMPLAAADKEQPGTRSLYLQLIQQARADGRAWAALAYLDDYERQYPGDGEAQVLRINSLLDIGKVQEAEALAGKLPPGAGNPRVSAARGHVAAARDRWAEAATAYRAAVQTNPADPMLLNALGYAELRSGHVDAAVERLRAAADLAPGDKVLRNNLLLALAVAGRDTETAAIIGTIADERERADLLAGLPQEAAQVRENQFASQDRMVVSR